MPRFTTRDGTEIYYKDWGSGKPVILIHGWPLSADSFDDHAYALAENGFRVISYDRRGFGRSQQPWNGYDYDTLSDDLADLIKAVGVQQAALVGFSMGGGEVARYLSRHGSANVSRAVLISSVVPYLLQTPDNPKGVPQSVFDGMTEGMLKDRAHFFKSFFKSFYGIGISEKDTSSEVLDWSFNQAMAAGLRPTLACANAFATTDFRPDLPAFKVPTLVIHGSADKTVPIDAAGRVAAAAIPGSELKVYDGPHGLLASHKEEIKNDLLAFL